MRAQLFSDGGVIAIVDDDGIVVALREAVEPRDGGGVSPTLDRGTYVLLLPDSDARGGWVVRSGDRVLGDLSELDRESVDAEELARSIARLMRGAVRAAKLVDPTSIGPSRRVIVDDEGAYALLDATRGSADVVTIDDLKTAAEEGWLVVSVEWGDAGMRRVLLVGRTR